MSNQYKARIESNLVTTAVHDVLWLFFFLRISHKMRWKTVTVLISLKTILLEHGTGGTELYI